MITQTSVQTRRFGAIEVTPEDVITFPDGLLGFPECTRFVVIRHKEGSPFRWLQSVQHPELAFLIVDPVHLVPDYAPLMEEQVADDLGLTEGTPRLVYTIVTIPPGNPQAMTLNLAGPIVINGVTRIARQLVLTDERYGTKHGVCDQPDHAGESDAA
jgi:flagellar assembly factor FliW